MQNPEFIKRIRVTDGQGKNKTTEEKNLDKVVSNIAKPGDSLILALLNSDDKRIELDEAIQKVKENGGIKHPSYLEDYRGL